jgi:hypothetical protein
MRETDWDGEGLKRWIFNLLAGFSLLLFVGTGVLWMRNYWIMEGITWNHSFATYGITSTRGVFVIWRKDDNWLDYGLRYATESPFDPIAELQRLSIPFTAFAGFFSTNSLLALKKTPNEFIGALGVPHWFPMLLFAVPRTMRIRSILKQRRLAMSGHCRRCGYNLTGNVSGVCPECAMSIERVPKWDDEH